MFYVIVAFHNKILLGIVSALVSFCWLYRNRVQQIVGATSNMMNRSGSVLPPPIDELSSTGFTSTETSSIRNALSVRNLDV